MKALSIQHLSKSFFGKSAVEDLSFDIEEGEIFGLLGHNGAGKSTTIGMILGMVAPDAGDVRVHGFSVQQQRSLALRHVGAIFESPAFFDYLSGWDNLKVLMSYSRGFDSRLAREMVEKVQLSDRIHAKVRTYSHGMRQRLALAQALLPEPRLLLLDEPTDGLDPEGIKWFRDFILNLRQERGMTVLFNSHLLAEVELMCDRVAILRLGSLIFHGKVDDMDPSAPQQFRLDISDWITAASLFPAHGVRWSGSGNHIEISPDNNIASLIAALVHHGIEVQAVIPQRRSLEQLYMKMGQKNLPI